MKKTTAILALAVLALSAVAAHADPLDAVRDRMAAATEALPATTDPPERAMLLLEAGRPDEAAALVPGLLSSGTEGTIAAARVQFAVQDLDGLAASIATLEREAPDDPEARSLVYRWWILRDDLARADAAVRARREAGDLTLADRFMAADLTLLLLDFDGAYRDYDAILRDAVEPADRARALHGLGTTSYRQRDFDASLEFLTRALEISEPDPDLLMDFAQTQIRLGRTDDAITTMELATAVSPHHEQAHYFLGNGYARKNYTQLMAAYPEAFADEEGTGDLAAADRLLAEGRTDAARAAYEKIHHAHPGRVDALVRLGSLDFGVRRYDDARRWFRQALDLCPEYGRAHNGLAKTLEARRLAVEVHRPDYEARFAALPMPDVPRIEEFVANWDALSPRHRKRVALSLEPWKRYIPVLIEGGATYYIKPLYELLSETPGQELLRDQRISYDSRLWDDVRGCGGYHTVTGIEDVERTIQDRYNTVLHELTHQVHTVLTADRTRQIQELYRQTKERDDAGADAFLSRYAGGSVWEYFAEGANSLESPRRDDYDTREIVRERLVTKDPALMALVKDLMTEADVESCYAAAYVNLGGDSIERGDPAGAVHAYRRALARAPEDERAAASLAFALELADSVDAALAFADERATADPSSATLALARAEALWHGGRGAAEAERVLTAARERVRDEERYRIDLELGRLRWNLGDARGSREAYGRALMYQSDSPSGLWGMAAAEALAGNWDAAWSRYEEAVRVRTGVVELREDYARDLLRAGETARAREQIEAALLLDPDAPRNLGLLAWVQLAEGAPDDAVATASRAVELGPWCDLARVTLAWSLRRSGRVAEADAALAPLVERMNGNAPPRYVYRPKWGRYEEVGTRPRVLQEILTLAENDAAGGEGTR